MPRFIVIARQEKYWETEIEAKNEEEAWRLSELLDEKEPTWIEIGCEGFIIEQIEEVE